MKIFVSQPMADRSDEDILKEREAMFDIADRLTGKAVERIESFYPGAPYGAKPLWFLGKALEKLSTADAVIFAPGWEKARGCIMEHEAAVRYGIPILVD